MIHRGAFSAVFSGLAHALEAAGVRAIDVVYYSGNAADSTNTFPPAVRFVKLPGQRGLKAVFALIAYLRREQPNILIVGPTYINLIALVAKLASGWKGKLIITHNHPLALAHRVSRKDNKYLARLLYRYADGSYGINPAVAQEALRYCRLRPETVGVIPCVLMPPAAAEAPLDAPPWGASRPQTVFVTVSRLTRIKNLPLLIRAFHRVRAQADAGLLIVGDGEERESLLAFIESLGLSDRVWLTGFVPSPRPYLRSADVFVLASDEEGFGQVITEALAVGLPVISTDAQGGGPRFILGESQFGALVPAGELEPLVEAMWRMTDPTHRRQFAEAGSRRVPDFYPSAIGGALLAFMDGL
jgi:glycosyltransferase involved in cell wall biosynthesis